jgi:hypothetical protein
MNEFDLRIKILAESNINSNLLDAIIFVNDTLEVSYKSAKCIFNTEPSPETVLEIYDRIVERFEDLELEDFDAEYGLEFDEDSEE